tara:strand:+ start:750 stop:1175 length:426 start_codon:yes stop_codon:yes gene_type:complete
MYNPAGFDPQGLDMNADLGDPRRQEKLPGGYATQGQAVSAPYAEANMKAAEKTNPMNAVSQEPGKDFLAGYLQKGGMEQGETAQMFNPFDLLGGGTQKSLEAGDRARAGEDPQVEQRTLLGRMLNRNAATAAAYNEMLRGR